MSFDLYADYFNRANLMDSIAKAPYVPGRLASVFESRALSSTVLAVEDVPANGATALTAVPRGTASRIETLEKRNVFTFVTSHYRADGSVYADEVLNIRATGVNGGVELITQRRDQLIARLRRDIDQTHEVLRSACLVTPTNSFGTKATSQQIALNTDATKTRKEIFDKITLVHEAALGGVPYTGARAFCNDSYWSKFIENTAVKATLLNYSMAQSLRNDPREEVFFGGVMWERYRGAGTAAITAATAIVIPEGVPGLFIQAFAPADTLDTVGAGALGTPYHAQSIVRPDNRGWFLEVQTNCVMVCTRPSAILTITTD